MAVLLETSRGDIVIDLFADKCPVACKNFLKLCKIKYYNNCLFHDVQRNFIVQSGDPTGTGKGGTSIYGLMYGEQARCFEDEVRPTLRHMARGMVGMASALPNANASQFYITTGEELQSLDGKHTIFGQVGEGLDVLEKINEAFVDDNNRPMQNIRIRHTIILEDPFDDPPELEALIPPASPEPQFEQGDRLEDDWVPHEDTRDIEQIEEETRKADAHNKAVLLEMIGDLPEADVKPPSNVLFICKLNPVTTEEDLEIIFARFGRVVDCDIIRDYKTGESLCYGFIGFEQESQCEEAYFKMNNVLLDDRRIKVDFSQSVSHLWKQFKKGGRKGGDASLMRAADTQDRQPQSRLELKQSHGRGPQGGGQHQLMLDEEDEERPRAAAAAAPVVRDAARYDRGKGGGSERAGRDGHRDRRREEGGGREGRREVDGERDELDRRPGHGGGRRDAERERDRGSERERERDRGDGRGADRERDRGYGRDSERERESGRDRDRVRGEKSGPSERGHDDRARAQRDADRNGAGGREAEESRHRERHRERSRDREAERKGRSGGKDKERRADQEQRGRRRDRSVDSGKRDMSGERDRPWH